MNSISAVQLCESVSLPSDTSAVLIFDKKMSDKIRSKNHLVTQKAT